MSSVRFTAKRLLISALWLDGIPYFSSALVGKWFGERFPKMLAADSHWKVRFLESSAWRLSKINPKELYFESIGLWLLSYHLRKTKPEHFAAASRLLVSFLEDKMTNETSKKKTMDAFARRIKKINDCPAHERRSKLKRLALRFGASEGTMYRWAKEFEKHGELSPRFHTGFSHPMVQKNFPKWLQIIKAGKAGLNPAQIADIVGVSDLTVRRTLQKEALILAETEKMANVQQNKTHSKAL
jgi:hypothetical protein